MPKRVDNNQAQIVKALRAVGARVYSTASLGRGFPDLCVLYRGVTILLELKSERGTLTEREAEFWLGFPGRGAIVRNVDEALAAIGAVEYCRKCGSIVTDGVCTGAAGHAPECTVDTRG